MLNERISTAAEDALSTKTKTAYTANAAEKHPRRWQEIVQHKPYKAAPPNITQSHNDSTRAPVFYSERRL